MPLIGFKTFLVHMILYGDPWWKLGTIRALRKVPVLINDVLFMYTGLRTKDCQYLGVTLCSHQYFLKMHLSSLKPEISLWNFTDPPLEAVNSKLCMKKGEVYYWHQREIEELAITDGFNSAKEMWSWFRENHGENDAIFQRIEWQYPPIKINRNLSTKQTRELLKNLQGTGSQRVLYECVYNEATASMKVIT